LPTRTAPGSPKINQNWAARLQHILSERGVSELVYMLRHSNSPYRNLASCDQRNNRCQQLGSNCRACAGILDVCFQLSIDGSDSQPQSSEIPFNYLRKTPGKIRLSTALQFVAWCFTKICGANRQATQPSTSQSPLP